MGKTNNKNLKINTLCLGFGSDDAQRTEVVYVQWDGKPFATAEECLRAFFTACDARISVGRSLPKCCEKSKKADSSAKFCSRCGKSLTKISSKRSQTMYSYINGLRTDIANFDEAVYPNETDQHCGDGILEGDGANWTFLFEPADEGVILFVPDVDGLLEAHSLNDLDGYNGGDHMTNMYRVVKRSSRELESGYNSDLIALDDEDEEGEDIND